MKKEQGMEYNLEIDDWVKLKDEEDSFHIVSIANSSGFIKVEDISGHTFVTEQSSIIKKLTNEEIYGFEPTTADEFNEEIITYGDKKLKDYGPPYGPHNPTGNEGEIK